MTRKSTGKRKTPAKKKPSRKTRSFKTQLQRSVAGLVLLLLLVFLAGVLAHHFVKKGEEIRSGGNLPIHQKIKQTPPLFEIYPPVETPVVKPAAKPTPAEALPKVAIIIDDIGYDRAVAEKFIGLDAVMTFSLLPDSPFADAIAREIHGKGIEAMLHLPMEPKEYPEVNPGPGTLLTSMTPNALIRQLEKNIDAVPFIKGVNNHMGSKMTTVSNQMYQILSILKKRGLFFIDSRTTADSLCRPSARLLQVPFAERDIFLDHVHEPEFIRQQLQRLVQIAQHRGEAVGIAHPNRITYEIFRQSLPLLKEKVRFVTASEVVHQVG